MNRTERLKKMMFKKRKDIVISFRIDSEIAKILDSNRIPIGSLAQFLVTQEALKIRDERTNR
jgi:hypothetical protein